MTIAALDSENTPLLSTNREGSSSPGSAANANSNSSQHGQSETDSTLEYVKVINEFLPWYKRPSVFWLLPIFGITWISTGMLQSSLGQFKAALLCREYLNRHTSNTTLMATEGVASFLTHTSMHTVHGLSQVTAAFRPAPECKVPEIQAFTAKILGFVEVVDSIASSLSAGYYTTLSDRHGRRIIIIIAFFNAFFVLCTLVAMAAYWEQIGLSLLVISGLINGLLGGNFLGLTMSLAYTADCTEPAKRGLAFSWLHAALYLGLAIGPYLGGSISRASGTILTVVAIDIVITLIALLLVVLILPESLPAKQLAYVRKLYPKLSKKDDPVVGTQERVPWHSHVVSSLAFFKPNGRNTNLILLAGISSLAMLAFKGSLSVVILYTNQVFQWTEYEDGIMFSLASFARLITILIFRPVLVHFYQKAFHKKVKKARAEAVAAGLPQEITPSQPLHRSRYDDPNRTLPIVVDPYDATGATSVQHLGEAALDLSSDESESIEEESFLARRQRQESVDSFTTLASGRPREPLHRSPRSFSSNISTSKNKDKATEPTVVTDASGRSQEETFSDMKFDTWMIRLGFAINSVTYIGYGLASETWMFYLATSLHAVCIIATPSIKSLLTHLVEPSQFGAALGALQVVDSIAAIFSPVVISWVYALTVKSMPEFVWYTCAAWTAIGVVLAFMIRQKQFRNNAIAV
ncbi:hypothetical protein BGZ70_009145 [Mortierella alpina]|uniref:Major facilitator superfamily (MFS) profile domain-containing protein n=1 Tax=Mortierella alpina TaxID=64518 RepID=A0A9P6M0T8_MORAP|nr:hypothetical protein BGZ70_009145 [Mortierella alpina]